MIARNGLMYFTVVSTESPSGPLSAVNPSSDTYSDEWTRFPHSFSVLIFPTVDCPMCEESVKDERKSSPHVYADRYEELISVPYSH